MKPAVRIVSARTGLTALIDVALLCRAYELPMPVKEYRFHPTRKFRFDWACPHRLLACEQEGGSLILGRHTRGQGFEDDCIKYDEAMLLGWTVLRVTPKMLSDGRAADLLKRALA